MWHAVIVVTWKLSSYLCEKLSVPSIHLFLKEHRSDILRRSCDVRVLSVHGLSACPLVGDVRSFADRYMLGDDEGELQALPQQTCPPNHKIWRKLNHCRHWSFRVEWVCRSRTGKWTNIHEFVWWNIYIFCIRVKSRLVEEFQAFINTFIWGANMSNEERPNLHMGGILGPSCQWFIQTRLIQNLQYD